MKSSTFSRSGSILLSAGLVVAFSLVQGPLWRPAQRGPGGIQIHRPVLSSPAARPLSVAAGKSLLVDSPVAISRAVVENPGLAAALPIDSHELLVNGKAPGVTTLTVWQQDGTRSSFALNVATGGEILKNSASSADQALGRQNLTISYQTAMKRVQKAITRSGR
jgi:Flp pilus assembly secretin CpaC